MNLFGIVVLTLAQTLADCVALVPINQTSSLKVVALDVTGRELPANIELYAEGNLVKAPLDRIPYGTYEMRVNVDSFREARHEIMIDQPRTFLRVEVHFDLPCQPPKPATLAGRIASELPPDLWIKVVPLRGIGSVVESKVESKGGFELRGLEYGEHIVLVTSGSKVLHQSVVQVSWNSKPMSIALAAAVQ